MERGFYHSDVGYWQTNSEPSLEVLANYPSGTTEIPIKPSADHQYLKGKWVYIAPLPPPPPTRGHQESLRQSAYTSEADPLFFKWQAGEATEEDWLAKRQEIRDRYPYPAE